MNKESDKSEMIDVHWIIDQLEELEYGEENLSELGGGNTWEDSARCYQNGINTMIMYLKRHHLKAKTQEESICDTAPYPQCNGANGCDTCKHQEEE